MSIATVSAVQGTLHPASRPRRATDHAPEPAVLRGEWLRAETEPTRAIPSVPPLFATIPPLVSPRTHAARAIRAYTSAVAAVPSSIDLTV